MTAVIAVLLFCVSARAQGPESHPALDVEIPASISSTPRSMPAEILIKADPNRMKGIKPPLVLEADEFETIRPDLRVDESPLLAVSPLEGLWPSDRPEFLMNDRVIQPWRTTFSDRPGIAFTISGQLARLLGGGKGDPKVLNYWGVWTITITDDEGRVFYHYEGSGDPAKEFLWSGQNDQGDWLRAGRSYSVAYTFTSPDGSPRASAGNPLLFNGIVHQEDTNLHINLDSSVLFGANKSGRNLQEGAGTDLLRATADLVKRRFPSVPIAVRVFAKAKRQGDVQAAAVRSAHRDRSAESAVRFG